MNELIEKEPKATGNETSSRYLLGLLTLTLSFPVVPSAYVFPAYDQDFHSKRSRKLPPANRAVFESYKPRVESSHFDLHPQVVNFR
mgnify:FL=1